MDTWIEEYGYAGLLLGAFLDSPTVVALGGFASARGFLESAPAFAAAALGAFASGYLKFALGRRYGAGLLARHPGWAPHADRLDALIARHSAAVLLTFRFLYGLRAAAPLALGAGTTGHGRFLGFNLAGALLWVGVWGLPGYLCGSAAEVLPGGPRRYDVTAVAAIVAVGVAARLLYVAARRGRAAGRA